MIETVGEVAKGRKGHFNWSDLGPSQGNHLDEYTRFYE